MLTSAGRLDVRTCADCGRRIIPGPVGTWVVLDLRAGEADPSEFCWVGLDDRLIPRGSDPDQRHRPPANELELLPPYEPPLRDETGPVVAPSELCEGSGAKTSGLPFVRCVKCGRTVETDADGVYFRKRDHRP